MTPMEKCIGYFVDQQDRRLAEAGSKTPTPFLESHPLPWTVEYDNTDDAFSEWWTVIDANGEPIARACSEEAAAWIVAAAAVTL